jgi:hypothetical protein
MDFVPLMAEAKRANCNADDYIAEGQHLNLKCHW